MAATLIFVKKRWPDPLPDTLPDGTPTTIISAPDRYRLVGVARRRDDRYYGDWQRDVGSSSSFVHASLVDWDQVRSVWAEPSEGMLAEGLPMDEAIEHSGDSAPLLLRADPKSAGGY